MNDIHVGAASRRFGQRALEHLVRSGSPHSDLDPVSGFEGLEKCGEVLFRDGRVQRQGAFVLRARAVLPLGTRAARGAAEQDRNGTNRGPQTGGPYRPAPNSSVYRFFHLSYSSIDTRASTNFIGTLLSGVSTFLLVGTKSRIAMIACPSGLSSKS